MTCPRSQQLGGAELDLSSESGPTFLTALPCFWVSTHGLMMVTPKPSESCPSQASRSEEDLAPGSLGKHLPGHHIPGCPHYQTFCTDRARGLEDVAVPRSIVRSVLTTFTESGKHWLLVAGQVGI